MSSSASDPKPRAVVTGYPAPASASASASVVGNPAAVAYPHPAPPPHATVPYNYHYQHQFSDAYPPPPPSYYPSGAASYSDSTSSLRRILAVVVVLFLVLGLAAFIFSVVLRPRIPEVTLSSASLSAFNLSSSSSLLSADFHLVLTFHNPNSKMGVYYEHLVAAAFYDDDDLAESALPPFYQPTGETTDVPARLVAASAYVSPDAAREIEAESGRGDGFVRFSFRMVSLARFQSGAWRMRWHVMRVSCDDVWIGSRNVTDNLGSNSWSPHKCSVGI